MLYKRNWTDEEILIEAKKFDIRSEWKAKSTRSYEAALRKGDLFFQKCSKDMTQYKKWTDKAIKADAKKYKRRLDWNINSKGAYAASLRRGKNFHEECCAHMKFHSR